MNGNQIFERSNGLLKFVNDWNQIYNLNQSAFKKRNRLIQHSNMNYLFTPSDFWRDLIRDVEIVSSILFFAFTCYLVYRLVMFISWSISYAFFLIFKLFKQIGINRCVRNLVSSRDQQMNAALKRFAHVEIPEKLGEQIMRATAVQLKEMLHSKKVTSEQLVVFFSRRSASVGLKLRG